jgi:hypothetical protein
VSVRRKSSRKWPISGVDMVSAPESFRVLKMSVRGASTLALLTAPGCGHNVNCVIVAHATSGQSSDSWRRRNNIIYGRSPARARFLSRHSRLEVDEGRWRAVSSIRFGRRAGVVTLQTRRHLGASTGGIGRCDSAPRWPWAASYRVCNCRGRLRPVVRSIAGRAPLY